MAVGSKFNDPATQAAIAAQAGQEPAADAQAAKPVDQTVEPNTDTTVAPAAKPAEPAHQVKPDETKAAADSDLNMDTTPNEPTKDADDKTDTTDDKTDKSDDPAKGKTIEDLTPEGLDTVLKEEGFDGGAIGDAMANNDGKVPEELIAKLKEKFNAKQVDEQVTEVEGRFKAKITEKNTSTETMNGYIYETLASGDAEKGKDNFAVLSTWCKENLDEAKIASINTLLRSGDKQVVHEGLSQAVNAWKKGKENPMMTGDADASATQTTPAFKPLSRDEFVQIVSTEKYNTDIEYAAEIDARRSKTIEQGGAGFMTPEYCRVRPPI